MVGPVKELSRVYRRSRFSTFSGGERGHPLDSTGSVHGPRVRTVQKRTRRGSWKADPADKRPEVNPNGAAVSSATGGAPGVVGLAVVRPPALAAAGAARHVRRGR